MNVVIRADASPLVGGGHAMRCLTLADELARRGASVTFVAAAMIDPVAELIGAGGHRLVSIGPPQEQVAGRGWDRESWTAERQHADAALTLQHLAAPPDWLICDHYGLDADWEAALRPRAERLLVIDDLANREHDCDILVDQTFGRAAADYAPLVPSDCTILTGANYAMLQPEFALLRPAALERRRETVPVRRLLISLGSTDIGGLTTKALEAAIDAGARCRIDVVLGAGAPSLAAIRSMAEVDPRIHLHVDTRDMAELIAQADIAIGAAGASTWERCCLGLPSLVLVLADNQRLIARRLAEEEAAVAVDDPDQIRPALAGLLADEGRRARMTAAVAAITDGVGVRRVAERMSGAAQQAADADISLRPASSADSELLWLWRNDPTMRAMAKTHEPIAWQDHARWYHGTLAAEGTDLYIVESGGAPAAMVRFDRSGDRALISINVNPAMRGRGIGKAALARACDAYAASGRAAELVAEVHSSNAASKRIFEAVGFRETGRSDSGYIGYARPVRSPGEEMG